LGAVGTLLFMLSCPDGDYEPELPRLRQNREATVLINVPGEGHGTGVAVSRCGHILTNAHVIESEHPAPINVFVVGHVSPFEARVVAEQTEHDLAIIKIDYLFEHIAVIENRDQTVIDGNESYSIGFPHNFGATISRGYVRQNFFSDSRPDSPPAVNDATMLGQRLEPGTSGSGIYAARDGRLIALMSHNMWSGNSILELLSNPIVIPVRHVRPFLEEHNIAYCQPPPTIRERIWSTFGACHQKLNL
jgi:S1-C subfamily serine protease